MKELNLMIDNYLPLRDVVFNTLREAILKGDIAPGERLMELDLASKLGVSRTPIREAIRKLELEGLVKMAPRKGAEVAEITFEDLRDVLEVRKNLEELAVDLACKRATQEDVKHLYELHEGFKESLKTGDLTVMAEADEAFHDAIYESTKNKRLIQIINNLREQMYRYRLECIKDVELRNTLVSEHQELVETIESRRTESAKKVVQTHINNQEKTIVENLTKTVE